jgi:hypothetical protein
MNSVKIAVNPHWYSKFWMKQFWQLYKAGEIKLSPLVTKFNPPYCFYFEVNGKPCLIDISDHKTLYENPAKYFAYFKANYSFENNYSANVYQTICGTTLTKQNVPLDKDEREFDIVWLAGISGGRPHKVAMFEALASLPLKMKLAAKMVGEDDYLLWGERLEKVGVEVWQNNLSYKKWLEWNKKARWCAMARGKHDCLSFRMVDYCSIKVGVLADYMPTSKWAVPVKKDVNYLSFGFSGPQTNDLTKKEVDRLCGEYKEKVWAMFPQIRDDKLRREVAENNYKYFCDNVENGQSARDVLKIIANI